jgi:formate C-acetyltransferase
LTALSPRISQLREQSLNAIPTLDPERALLLTQFYKSDESKGFSIPVRRALAFKYVLENKSLCLNEGELIVGEKGTKPKATPTFPELCIHTPEDLDILDSREKISFKVSKETKDLYNDTIRPFWTNRSIREKIFKLVPQEWIDAYEAGVFTEFQEQRAPGHTVLGNKIYLKGFLDIKQDIQESIDNLDFFNDREALDKLEELKAMHIAVDALILFADRYNILLTEAAQKESDPQRQDELLTMAKICNHVPRYAPRTFWEALQYYWFVHLGVTIELNTWDSFNPGRLDQHLYPFYQKGMKEGSLTLEKATELLQSFWIKFNNQPAPPKVGITAEESATYTDFCTINIGGVKDDGSDASNDVSYLLLDVIEEMRLLQPSSMVQLSKKNPNKLIKRALRIIKTGYGQPSIFEGEELVDVLKQELLEPKVIF